MKTYRIRACWDRPGIAQRGGEDLGEGWCRVYDTAVVEGPHAVAAYLKGHPDAESASVNEVEVRNGREVIVSTHLAERTILGWLIGTEAPPTLTLHIEKGSFRLTKPSDPGGILT